MCDPLTLTAVGLATASGVASTIQADQAAKDQNEFNERMFETNKELATAEAANAHEALVARSRQEREASAQEITHVSREADLARSAGTVAALESGVAGASVEAIIEDFDRQEAEFVNATQRNTRFRDEQFERDSLSIQTQRTGRIESARRAEVPRPNFLNSLLQIGSSAFSAGVSVYGAQGGFQPSPAPTSYDRTPGFIGPVQ